MKIGFTGTQQGMTEAQQEKFVELIQTINPKEFHHGDCIGADKEANDIVHAIYGRDLKIVVHPPTNPHKRAWTSNWTAMRPQRDYLQRNHDLVRETDMLIATPKEAEEVLRSGTWATIRFARKIGKEVIVIKP